MAQFSLKSLIADRSLARKTGVGPFSLSQLAFFRGQLLLVPTTVWRSWPSTESSRPSTSSTVSCPSSRRTRPPVVPPSRTSAPSSATVSCPWPWSTRLLVSSPVNLTTTPRISPEPFPPKTCMLRYHWLLFQWFQEFLLLCPFWSPLREFQEEIPQSYRIFTDEGSSRLLCRFVSSYSSYPYLQMPPSCPTLLVSC